MTELPPGNNDLGAEDWADEQSVADLFNGGDTQTLHERLSARTPNGSRASTAPADPYGELKSRIHHVCINKLGPQLFRGDIDPQDLASRVQRVVTDQLKRDGTPLAHEERQRLIREVAADILGYGPIEPLLHDESVTEIMVNGFDRVYVERRGKLEPAPVVFGDDAHLLQIIDRIVSMIGRRIDESSPMVDARLPDGSRVNAIIPPLALDGPALSIRRFGHEALSDGRPDPHGQPDVRRRPTSSRPACGRAATS